MKRYSENNLNDFGSVLRVSKLSGAIDAIDSSILNNSITANPIIEYVPTPFVQDNPTFNFGTKLVKPYAFQSSRGFAEYKPSIKSSVFNYQGICAVLQDDGNGNIQIVNSDTANRSVINPSVGTVDYDNGVVKLVSFAVNGFVAPAIKIIAVSSDVNIRAPKSRILSIKDSDVVINIIEND